MVEHTIVSRDNVGMYYVCSILLITPYVPLYYFSYTLNVYDNDDVYVDVDLYIILFIWGIPTTSKL